MCTQSLASTPRSAFLGPRPQDPGRVWEGALGGEPQQWWGKKPLGTLSQGGLQSPRGL